MYGVAVACYAYGFLAVFAAGLFLRRVERVASGPARRPATEALARAGASDEDVAADPNEAPAYMAQAVLAFNEQLELIGEVAVVVVVGSLLSPEVFSWRVLGIVASTLRDRAPGFSDRWSRGD